MVLVGRYERKGTSRRSKLRWEEEIKNDLKETG
jgi:hypothetical protein